MGNDAMSDLSLRFPVFGSHRTLWAYVANVSGPPDALALRLCSEIIPEQVRSHPHHMVFCGVFAVGGEPARRGTDWLTADT